METRSDCFSQKIDAFTSLGFEESVLKIRQSTRPHFRIGVRRKPTTYSPSTAPTTLSTTPSPPSPFAFSRPTKIIPPRRKYFAHTTTSRILESQETSTKPYSEVRFKFPTRRTSTLASTTQQTIREYTADQALQSSHMVSPTTQQTIRDYTADQDLQSSHMVSSNEDMENSESIEAIIRTDGLQKSTSPLLGYNTINLFTEAITRNHAKVSSPATQFKATTESSLPQRLVVKSTTPRVVTYTSKPTPFPSISRKTRKPLRTTTQPKPNIIHTQDKYDDFEASILSMLPAQSKVLIHSNGNIECLDQGSFPHPVSCKKFISCARMGRGRIYGWEYTCPKNLSFDPIGGMCNWAADLDCND